MDGLIKEGFISRKLAKTDKGYKADTVLKVWCAVDSVSGEESCKKTIDKLEKESSINQEISMPYDILAILGVLDYPQSKFNKIAKKCEDIDYKWLLWVDDKDPNYESMKNNAIKIWKAGQYKVIAPNGGGDYLIYSLKNGKFFDYFHEQDTGEKLDWLKTGVTYKDAINQVKKNIAAIQSKNQSAVKESSANKLIETKLRIYESCDNGIITKEDKNDYLSLINDYLTEAEVASYQDKSFRSDILNPDKIFKDLKNSYIEIHYPGIEERKDLQKFILSLSKKAFSLIDKEIDNMYDNWYDEDDHITKAQVKLMARNLFDIISLKKSNKKDNYWVEIWVNAIARHKDSDNFFGCHCMTVTYEIDPKTCKVLKTFDVDFGG